MRIVWHGHACFEVNDGVTVVTDPHDGKSIGIAPPSVEADVVLLSHDHYDHNCARIVGGNPSVVESMINEPVMGMRTRAFQTYHDEQDGRKRGENRVYKFELDGVSFCHLGDLGHPLSEEMISALGDIDVLFIPVGSVFTIDGETAWKMVTKVQPKVAVPMHYRVKGLSLSIRPLGDFLDQVSTPTTRVGNEVSFEKEDLPQSTEIWVFSL
jgi:L-ascorbate metabolism protein UlaG (beta-lactamase superfamily)